MNSSKYREPNLDDVIRDEEDIDDIIFKKDTIKNIEYLFRQWNLEEIDRQSLKRFGRVRQQ
jgi:hypothetical protein